MRKWIADAVWRSTKIGKIGRVKFIETVLTCYETAVVISWSKFLSIAKEEVVEINSKGGSTRQKYLKRREGALRSYRITIHGQGEMQTFTVATFSRKITKGHKSITATDKYSYALLSFHHHIYCRVFSAVFIFCNWWHMTFSVAVSRHFWHAMVSHLLLYNPQGFILLL